MALLTSSGIRYAHETTGGRRYRPAPAARLGGIGLCWHPSDSKQREKPQAIDVIGDPQQQRLQTLRHKRSAWCSGRQLAFDGRDEALNECAAAIEVRRKCLAHLGPYPNGMKLSSNILPYQCFACVSAWSGSRQASLGQRVTAWGSIHVDQVARRLPKA
jgi:hypothetical protein